MKKLSLLFVGLAVVALACNPAAPVSIVPEPVQVTLGKGTFNLSKLRRISFVNTDPQQEGAVLSNLQTCFAVQPERMPTEKSIAALPDRAIQVAIYSTPDTLLGNEGYRLTVTRRHITVQANTGTGLFYALQTLRQLAPVHPHRLDITVPAIEITDYPRFEWRGSHRDVSRHFFDTSHIKKHLDLMALYKLNKFHWHLTDDHGWRVAIDRYPELTDIGAWRVDRRNVPWTEGLPPQPGEEATDGGYYTKQEIREIIQYAAQRHIEIIPEIEIPGHCSAILAACPQYACDNYPYYVQTGPYWPPKAILCGGNDEVMRFLKNVLDEVAALFPSTYIHIGGDEAVKDNWKVCPKCQRRIADLRLEDEEALQGWMIREIEQHLARHGKQIIGWDEMLDGHVSPTATVMYWRGWLGDSLVVDAVRRGHPVIMTPNSHCYFDYYQIESDPAQKAIGGYLPLAQAYAFEPVPAALTAEEARHIMGGQCNLWAEFLYTPAQAEYMLLPRLLALSECVWTPKERKSFPRFEQKLPPQQQRLGALGYNYCGKN